MTKYTPEMTRAIRWAEGQSIRTCEECSKPGARLEADGMIRTRCAEHTPPESVPWEFQARFPSWSVRLYPYILTRRRVLKVKMALLELATDKASLIDT